MLIFLVDDELLRAGGDQRERSGMELTDALGTGGGDDDALRVDDAGLLADQPLDRFHDTQRTGDGKGSGAARGLLRRCAGPYILLFHIVTSAEACCNL